MPDDYRRERQRKRDFLERGWIDEREIPVNDFQG